MNECAESAMEAKNIYKQIQKEWSVSTDATFHEIIMDISDIFDGRGY